MKMAKDQCEIRFKKWTAVTPSQGFKREWKLRSEMRSPAWTTSINEVRAG